MTSRHIRTAILAACRQPMRAGRLAFGPVAAVLRRILGAGRRTLAPNAAGGGKGPKPFRRVPGAWAIDVAAEGRTP